MVKDSKWLNNIYQKDKIKGTESRNEEIGTQEKKNEGWDVNNARDKTNTRNTPK